MSVLNISDTRPAGLMGIVINSAKFSCGTKGVICSAFSCLSPLIILSEVTKNIFVNFLYIFSGMAYLQAHHIMDFNKHR